MSQILTQNGKMRKSSQNGIDVYNFGIPAFQSETGLKTCPNARQCATGCYARSGTYRFGNVVNAYENRLKLTQDASFIETMVIEVQYKTSKSRAKGNQCLIRIHDSGDFYSKEYAMSWFEIINKCPNTRFYAYTKMVQMFEEFKRLNLIPPNLNMIYSQGGSEDSHIDTNKHRHSRVFESETALIEAGYIDATQDDMIAALGVSNRIGLVYHGSKKYANTAWSKVS
jgi:hypothetical protein